MKKKKRKSWPECRSCWAPSKTVHPADNRSVTFNLFRLFTFLIGGVRCPITGSSLDLRNASVGFLLKKFQPVRAPLAGGEG